MERSHLGLAGVDLATSFFRSVLITPGVNTTGELFRQVWIMRGTLALVYWMHHFLVYTSFGVIFLDTEADN